MRRSPAGVPRRYGTELSCRLRVRRIRRRSTWSTTDSISDRTPSGVGSILVRNGVKSCRYESESPPTLRLLRLARETLLRATMCRQVADGRARQRHDRSQFSHLAIVAEGDATPDV